MDDVIQAQPYPPAGDHGTSPGAQSNISENGPAVSVSTALRRYEQVSYMQHVIWQDIAKYQIPKVSLARDLAENAAEPGDVGPQVCSGWNLESSGKYCPGGSCGCSHPETLRYAPRSDAKGNATQGAEGCQGGQPRSITVSA